MSCETFTDSRQSATKKYIFRRPLDSCRVVGDLDAIVDGGLAIETVENGEFGKSPDGTKNFTTQGKS
jgi:hypothetical protein